MTTTIDVRFMEAPAWAAQMTTLLAPYGTIPKLLTEDEWRGWAAAVINLPALSALNAPRPEVYESWQDWGRAFNLVARLLTA